jgi:hypothetical protein
MVIFGKNSYFRLLSKELPKIKNEVSRTTVEKNDFPYMLLKEIEIPENINKIESKAFRGNILTKITIVDNVLIEKNGIGNGFEEFYEQNNKIAGTYKRKTHKWKDKNWVIYFENFGYMIEDNKVVIIDYDGDEIAIIPKEINERAVTVIYQNAFKNKGLTEVNLPISITLIKDFAFQNNNLTKINIPNSVIEIGAYAFANNELSSVVFGNKVKIIGDFAFIPKYKDSGKISSIYFPSSVSTIGQRAFEGHPITSVSIGQKVGLGSDPKNAKYGILGYETGFNTVYNNSNRISGVYSRNNTKTTTWNRVNR